MLHILSKKNLPLIMQNHFFPIFIVFILATVLTYKKFSPIQIWLSIILLYFYSYFVHIFFHYLPTNINLHVIFHHNNDKKKSAFIRYFNLYIECLSNISIFIAFYYLQRLCNIKFVPAIIIFYYAIFYTTIHIINYSLFHCSKAHSLHHQHAGDIKKSCNYGPDIIDQIFLTSCNNTFEDQNHILLNILFAFLISYYVFKPTIF